MNSDSDEEEELPEGAIPYDIGEAAERGEVERIKDWLAADPHRGINDANDQGWTLLLYAASGHGLNNGDNYRDINSGNLELARYHLARGADVNHASDYGMTPLHLSCQMSGEAPAMVRLLLDAGASMHARCASGYDNVGHNAKPIALTATSGPYNPRRGNRAAHAIMCSLLRAGASLDSVYRGEQSVEDRLRSHEQIYPHLAEDEHFIAVKDLVASVRKHGSWKALCIAPHRMVLILRSLVARGRVKLPRTRRRSPRDRGMRQERALEFVVRQGDNGVVWNILSFWRATN